MHNNMTDNPACASPVRIMPHGYPTSGGDHGHKADLALPPELEDQPRHGNGDQDGDGSGWPNKLPTTQVAKRLTRTGLQESRDEQWWIRDGLRMGKDFHGDGELGMDWDWGVGMGMGSGEGLRQERQCFSHIFLLHLLCSPEWHERCAWLAAPWHARGQLSMKRDITLVVHPGTINQTMTKHDRREEALQGPAGVYAAPRSGARYAWGVRDQQCRTGGSGAPCTSASWR